MLINAHRRTLYLWIALLAILFGNVAPTVSRVINPLAQFAAGSICLTDQDGQRPAGDPAMQACAYCLPHATSQATLPLAPYSLAVIGGHDRYDTPDLAPPHLRHFALRSNARAPPVSA